MLQSPHLVVSLEPASLPQNPGRAAHAFAAVLICICALAAGMLMAGCGGSSGASPKAGAITMANAGGASGNISALAVASRISLSMMPSGDKINAGVDWTMICGGNAVTGSISNGACGTLTPAHTAGGAATMYTAPSTVPIGNTITITATVTSNPSQTRSVTLTVLAAPIAVDFVLTTPPPTTLMINASLHLAAQVSNDPTGAGVIWTANCSGASACGSFNPAETQSLAGTVYTAPSAVPPGGAVTITATSLTDTTKSASFTVTISGPPPPLAGITISVLPATLYAQTVGPAHNGKIAALVTNDPAMAGVDWSVSCGASACGSVTPHTASGAATTFSAPSTAPPDGTVTIKASSTSNPAISATATAMIVKARPIVVSFTAAPPATLTTGAQATLTASVASDTSKLGVDWTASCGSAGACGSFSVSPAHTASGGQIVYTAPATVPQGGAVAITAASPATTPANPAVAFTAIVAVPPSISFAQEPPATLTANTQAKVSATVANDVAPGGVLWSVADCGSATPGGCGFVLPAQTASGAAAAYTAPPAAAPGTSVTLVATSVSDPSATVSSTRIAITPATTLAVSFIPSLPAQVQANATVSMTAAVANDASASGVDWQVCASNCGFFTVKPAIPAIPATATTPYVPPVAAVTATTVSGWPNGLPIPYTAPSTPPDSGTVVVVAAAHADPSKANSGIVAVTTAATGPPVSGVVRAGATPVAGSSVALFAAGVAGYGSAASQIAQATADKNGSFTIAAGYTCPSSTSQMYLVASGGSAGTSTANPNLVLMTALGSCNALGSAPVVVNEATSVASAFATAPFSANDELSGNASYLYLGASSGNLTGLANAFAAVHNLVDITTGLPRFVTPAGNAAVPYVEINTLADALNGCAVTSGGAEGDGSACGNLFTATDVLPGNHALYNAIGPVDTLQAAFNAAQHPVTNYGYTLGPPGLQTLASANSPFQPILTSEPNDWSISLNYTSGGGLSTASAVGSFAIDGSGNLWITDTKAGSVIEWNPQGAALSPATGFAAGGGPIAIDASGNIWISADGQLTELNSLGSPAPGSPFKGAVGGGVDMAFDAQSNLWIANGAGVNEFDGLGQAVSPAGGFVNNGVTGISALGVDSSNNLWVGNGNSLTFAELTNPGGQLITSSITQGAGTVLPQLAADGSGQIWGVTSSVQVLDVPPYGGKGTSIIPTAYSTGVTGQGDLALEVPAGLAFDGARTLWIAGQGGTNFPPAIYPLASGMSAIATNSLVSPSLSQGTLRVAVDGSGNVWVLLAGNSVTEYIGVATPVVTPLSLGVKNRKLAAKP